MKRRSRCFTNYAPVLCVRSVIRLAISTQLRWMNRSWAGVQKVKGVAFTIRQSSLVRLRYVPERLPLRGTTIPQPVRAALRLKDGDELAYEIEGNRVILTKASAGTIDDPFATFGEWHGEADRKAYAKL